MHSAMKVVLLAGGLGSRLREETTLRPKPLVEIGGYPMLWHIMNIYAAHGFDEFVVALGYRGSAIKDYFTNYHRRACDLTIKLRTGEVTVRAAEAEDWTVHLLDTGLHTATGGRTKRAAKFIGDETFMLTYGDGVADLDIGALLRFHRSHGRLATVTAARPSSRFGGLQLDGDGRVAEFEEKPQLGAGWVNGGFFVLEPGVADYIESDEVPFERAPLERLAADGQLAAYQHEGFWQPMDTMREVELLEGMWQDGTAPWRVW
jgi:glucose-1-phosphate cytidylyltransferase